MFSTREGDTKATLLRNVEKTINFVFSVNCMQIRFMQKKKIKIDCIKIWKN